MATKKTVRCHGCGLEFDTMEEAMFTNCPTCGLLLKVNKRWEPEGAQYITEPGL